MGPYQGSLAIVGGGISGATLAIALQARGIKSITLYEQAPKFGEIGAGVSFNPAAVRAMSLCSPDITAAYRKVHTGNLQPGREHVFFTFNDAQADTAVGAQPLAFELHSKTGASGVHRAHYLDQVVQLLPEHTTVFGKHLDTIEELASGKVKLRFADGTTATHDAVIGADGIKSAVRSWLVGGADHPGAAPVYTHKYAYRGLIPMAKAREALGDALALNAHMHLGRNGHVLTFPVNHGAVLNVVAFYTDDGDWSDGSSNHAPARLTRHATRAQVQADFKHFGATVKKIVDLLDENLDCWAIFDTGDTPLSRFDRGRVLVLGDAAHATSPHHGSGAGMCVEDCAVLAELLADGRVAAAEAEGKTETKAEGKEGGAGGNGSGSGKGIEAAFRAFTKQRLERTQWLVQSSRRIGEMYDLRTELGDDWAKVEKEAVERHDTIWNGMVEDYVKEAKEILGEELKK